MDDQPSDIDDEAQGEVSLTPRERELVAEAHAAYLQTGEYVAWEDVKAWIASLGTQDELPLPRVRQRS